MQKTNQIRIGIVQCFLLLCYVSSAQDTSFKHERKLDSALLNTFTTSVLPFPNKRLADFDSVTNTKLLFAFHSLNKDSIRNTLKKELDSRLFSKKSLLQFRGGYINYNWSYRSQIDTPFLERDISQHFLTSSFSFTIAQAIPLRVLYFGRQTNSVLFRDFNDFRIEFDVPEFNRLKKARLASYIKNAMEQVRDPVLKPSIDVSNRKVNDLQDWLNSTPVVNALLRAREKVIVSRYSDSLVNDTALQAAKTFIAFYEGVKQKKDELQQERDSLMQTYIKVEKDIQKLQQIINGNTLEQKSWDEATKVLNESGMGSHQFLHQLKGLYAVKTFAVGKTMPAYSNLTMKNIGVKGINYEYNNNSLYWAFTAGAIDYRIRDFIYKKQNRFPEYVYALRLGYGRKEGNNLILTYYRGKKQLFVTAPHNMASAIVGVSLSSQLLLGKNAKMAMEIAQSALPAGTSTSEPAAKSYFSLHNRNSSALSVQLKSFIPLTKTKLEGAYQYTGLNFQNFTGYKVNSATDQWFAKAEQNVWKRQLFVTAIVQKNNFTNPYVLQRYNANTIFKSITATFRKRHWPSFTLGYMPSSQYTMVDSLLFESHYQILNAVVNHQYKMGLAQGASSFIYSKFFNNSLDSGFVFYNSNNYYFNQLFFFSRYTTILNVSHTYNNQYTLNVLDAAVNAKIFKQNSFGLGTKINLLDKSETKIGYYATTSLILEKVGSFSLRLEKSYLPGFHHSLIKSEFYNVGFTRYLQ